LPPFSPLFPHIIRLLFVSRSFRFPLVIVESPEKASLAGFLGSLDFLVAFHLTAVFPLHRAVHPPGPKTLSSPRLKAALPFPPDNTSSPLLFPFSQRPSLSLEQTRIRAFSATCIEDQSHSLFLFKERAKDQPPIAIRTKLPPLVFATRSYRSRSPQCSGPFFLTYDQRREQFPVATRIVVWPEEGADSLLVSPFLSQKTFPFHSWSRDRELPGP